MSRMRLTAAGSAGTHVASAENKLIDLLPRRDRLRLAAVGKRVDMRLGQVLCNADERTRHVYFPTRGFASLISGVDSGPVLEVGMVGREGILGAHLALGVDVWPLTAVVQSPGEALRVDAQTFKAELRRSAALQSTLHRYIYVRMAELTSACVCVQFHDISHRLARWLLMCHDRACSNCFCVTQECLAHMLGVRRVSITNAASELRRLGLIDYRRSRLEVLDRPGLVAAACSCHAADRHAYSAQLWRAPSKPANATSRFMP